MLSDIGVLRPATPRSVRQTKRAIGSPIGRSGRRSIGARRSLAASSGAGLDWSLEVEGGRVRREGARRRSLFPTSGVIGQQRSTSTCTVRCTSTPVQSNPIVQGQSCPCSTSRRRGLGEESSLLRRWGRRPTALSLCRRRQQVKDTPNRLLKVSTPLRPICHLINSSTRPLDGTWLYLKTYGTKVTFLAVFNVTN